jgi:methionyl-tRNA formyltransferase
LSPFKIAFLGYNAQQTPLIGQLKWLGHSVTHLKGPVADLSEFDRIVSFGYRHILRSAVLSTARHPILNLHISMLPFNKGAHPNFWAWIDRTPHGVTLHELDAGVDTGPILEQHPVFFDDDQITLRQSHSVLINRIEAAFLEILPVWLSGSSQAKPQLGQGTYHAVKDLPKWVHWDMTAREARERYDAER